MSLIMKASDEMRVAYGWASVIEENGQITVDLEGDGIDPLEIEKAAHEFMATARKGGFMHAKGADGKIRQIGEVVASFPLTREIQKAFGMDLPQAGWIIGVKIHDDAVWKMVKDGTLKAFSIGGRAIRKLSEE